MVAAIVIYQSRRCVFDLWQMKAVGTVKGFRVSNIRISTGTLRNAHLTRPNRLVRPFMICSDFAVIGVERYLQ